MVRLPWLPQGQPRRKLADQLESWAQWINAVDVAAELLGVSGLVRWTRPLTWALRLAARAMRRWR
jgi:hypothetical protein